MMKATTRWWAIALFCLPVLSHAQWLLQTTLPGGPPLTSISVVHDSIAWCSGFFSAVYRTTNRGVNWVPTAPLPNSGEAHPVIKALSATTAFVGGSGAGFGANIYRTTNGGQSWNVVYTAGGVGCFWNGIHFFDNQNGIAQSDPPTLGGQFIIVKTTDGGSTWSPIASPPSANSTEYGYQNSFYFHDTLHGWFGTSQATIGGNAGRVFRTTNGGETWTGFGSGNIGAVFAVRFVSPLTGVRTSGEPPFLTRSTDGGQSWVPVNSLPVPNIRRITAAAGVNTATVQQLWICGDSGATSRTFALTSLDGGATWHPQTISNISPYTVHHMDAITTAPSYDSVLAFAVAHDFQTSTSGGQVLVYRQGLGMTTDMNDQTQLPAEFSLSQNFPNPFNPSTRIAFSVHGTQFTTLRVYDVLGREVRTLVNEQKSPGMYSVQWDATGVASGVYLYRMTAGQFVQTRKLLLLR